MDEEEMEPIVRAVEGGDVEEVARLLDAEPHLMEGGDHDDDPSPLILAAERGHVGVVRLLLERGADVNFRSDYGHTALYEAAERGHEEVVSILLGCGADLSSKDGTGSTPLMGACCEGHLSVARQLLQHMQGRGLDERDDEGSTALWWACCRGHVEILRALLLAGVHHTIAERYGQTPRQAAQARGHAECVALLEWWEGELERGYVVHRARCLAEQHSLLQPTLAAAAASLASVSIPAFLSMRTPVLPPLPHVEVVRLLKVEETGASTGQGKGKVEEEGGADVQGPSEAERDATVKYVMEDLHPELYIELMAGFRPLRSTVQEADNEDDW